MSKRRRSENKTRSPLDYRMRKRAESHQDAMGEGLPPPPDVPDLPMVPKGEPPLVTEDDGVREIIDHCREIGTFAYDTEFIGELSYFPRLCVIQLATRERIGLIDPLADVDLTPLWEAIADPDLLTLVHAGQQDLEPVYRFLERPAASIFDTQIAAGFMGQPYPVSLRKLTWEVVGVRLGKALTFTHWDHRPLSARHRRYAADDVRYLPAIHAAMSARLAELGHVPWAGAECGQLTDPALYTFSVDHQYLRIKGAQKLDRRRMTILRELVMLRDTLAREHDMPPKSLLQDQLLLRLARDQSRTVDDLREVRGMPRPLVDSAGPAILDAIERGREAPPVKPPTGARDEETAADRARIDGLTTAIAAYCLARRIDPGLVLNRAQISELHRWIRKGRRPSESRLLEGWRGELLGAWLDGFVGGDNTLNVRWADEGLGAV